eukprot:TRINITY_DN15803_c0_g1_i1.p1 TRINITY_DN15803_c0_g1~~TRINITY_DN15803_c0_g1_i1.p1  ORF type:complete len:286 (-),score=76.29 TRINITY_DN15803_c0_g1_i1:83-940(-)
MATTQQKLEEIRSGLNKKQTFLSSCSSFESLLQEQESTNADFTSDIFSVLQRISTLLRTRYTDIHYWRTGRKLFNIAERMLSSQTSPVAAEQLKSVKEWKKLANAELKDEEGGDEKPKPTTATATSAPEPAAPPTQNQLPQLPPLPDNATPEAQMMYALLSSMLQQENEAGLPGMNSLEEMIMSQSVEESGPPPASRDARYNLHVITIEESGVLCSVCQEEFSVGGKAKQLPCKHFFHYDCALEWLERHNTCPMCRHQLPTEKRHFDDIAERIRQRETSKMPLYS